MNTISHLKQELKRYEDKTISDLKILIDVEYDRRLLQEIQNKKLVGK